MKTKITLDADAKMPTKANNGDVGWDLYSCVETVLEPMKVTKVNTGVHILPVQEEITESYMNRGLGNIRNIEKTFYTKIEGRSGLASKGIFPVGGIVDTEYTGSLIVCLVNFTTEPYHIKLGDKIAQLVYYHTNLDVEFEKTDKLENTVRSEAGFGSSGR